MTIPVVDLSEFLSGEESRKQQFVQALGKAYEEVGFVPIKNVVPEAQPPAGA